MRAQRLIEIVSLLRRARRPTTALSLSEALEVTPRTIYRDVATLTATGVPIRGEAGVGYVLGDGYDLPPLMFTAPELEALMLGARMVASRADARTADDAESAIEKILAAIPKERRGELLDAPLHAPNFRRAPDDVVDLEPIRQALRRERKIFIAYADAKGAATERVVWPFSLGYYEGGRALVAWCELRDDYRVFRTDRIAEIEARDERYPRPRRVLAEEWRAIDAASPIRTR